MPMVASGVAGARAGRHEGEGHGRASDWLSRVAVRERLTASARGQGDADVEWRRRSATTGRPVWATVWEPRRVVWRTSGAATTVKDGNNRLTLCLRGTTMSRWCSVATERHKSAAARGVRVGGGGVSHEP